MTERKGIDRVNDYAWQVILCSGTSDHDDANATARAIASDLDALAAAKEAAGPVQKLVAAVEADGADPDASLFFTDLHWMDWPTVGQFREFMRAIDGKRDGERERKR